MRLARPLTPSALWWILAVVSALSVAVSCQSRQVGIGVGETFQVIRVVDGDTIIIEGGIRVRYIGMNAPEMDAPLGPEAKESNRSLVEGRRVRLEKDVSETDRYGRLLRYVYVDNLMVNAEMVRIGLAYARHYPPDTKYQDYIDRMEREARQAKRGIWAGEGASLVELPV